MYLLSHYLQVCKPWAAQGFAGYAGLKVHWQEQFPLSTCSSYAFVTIMWLFRLSPMEFSGSFLCEERGCSSRMFPFTWSRTWALAAALLVLLAAHQHPAPPLCPQWRGCPERHSGLRLDVKIATTISFLLLFHLLLHHCHASAQAFWDNGWKHASNRGVNNHARRSY